jgi:murein DD-endopeptidase MepM/ murein hydrolase activator NlpD
VREGGDRVKARRRILPFLVVSGALFAALPGVANGDRGTLWAEMKRSADRSESIMPSGLEPVFPEKFRCPEIASPFGSQTRYDGSRRPSWAPGGGSHGGIDITLAEGTNLLALAAGTVAAKGEGGRMLGIYVWLRHSPEDTGLPYWVFSKYQHLEALPEIPIGAKVSLGQLIGRSGKTGTTGGHYGFNGYPHLHLTTVRSGEGEYQVEESRVISRDGRIVDPLVLYREAGQGMERTGGASPSEKGVVIPYVAADGRAWPANTRVVWPVACPPTQAKQRAP